MSAVSESSVHGQDLRDLSLMFAELLPGISSGYRRKLLAHLRSLDADGDGYVSLWELKMALKMLRVVRVKPKAAVNVSAAVSAAGSTWVLEEFRFEARKKIPFKTKMHSALGKVCSSPVVAPARGGAESAIRPVGHPPGSGHAGRRVPSRPGHFPRLRRPPRQRLA